MPDPRPKETRDNFMRRCIPQLIREGKPQEQAVAICGSMWQQKKKE